MNIKEFLIRQGFGCCLKEMQKKDFKKIVKDLNAKFQTNYDLKDDIPETYLKEIIT